MRGVVMASASPVSVGGPITSTCVCIVVAL